MIPQVKRIYKLLSAIFIAAFLSTDLSASFAFAQTGNARVGKIKSFSCQRCHGEKGLSNNPNYPNLAGQQEKYLIQALKDYKNGKRKNYEMKSIAIQLSDSNIKDLAAYYSSIKITYK